MTSSIKKVTPKHVTTARDINSQSLSQDIETPVSHSRIKKSSF